MKDLSGFSDDELQAELNRRNAPPDQLEEVDLTSLRAEAKNYIDTLHETGRQPKDSDHYMFENVMKTLYGPDIFDWINPHLQ